MTGSADPLRRIELFAGTTHLVLAPALGGKIVELHAGGRQWLWQSDIVPLAQGVDGASYVLTADSGGFDECFPTVGPCRLAPGIEGYGGLELPDHGELWSAEPAFEFATDDSGAVATCAWNGRRMPYRLVRRLQIGADGTVTFDYTLANDGKVALPFVWSSHPLFPLTPQTRLVLPAGARLRVYDQHGLALDGSRDHPWPGLGAGTGEPDFTHPWSVADRYACKLFIDVTEGFATLAENGMALSFRFDPAEVTHVGLWINKRGWTPFPGRQPYLNLALEPAIGAPDTLSEALGAWRSAAWLAAGAERRWRMTLSAASLPR